MIRNYQHIIWDWNGTLLDDLALSLDLVNDMLIHRGLIPLTLERYREVFTFPVQSYYESIGFDFAREAFEELSSAYVTAYKSRRHECSLYPEARIILEHVHGSGQSQSVLSAHDQETLSELVAAFDVIHLFQHLIGLENSHAISKIHQGRRLLTMLRIQASEVLLIGDTQHDAEVAQALGIDCVLVSHGHQTKNRLKQRGVPVVDSLSELLEEG
jgi:phosphoglycolate phosphatase